MAKRKIEFTGEVSVVVLEDAPKKHYDTADWKGVKTVFRCETCGTCRDEEDAMIEHVLIHVPKADQEKVFNQLVKEK